MSSNLLPPFCQTITMNKIRNQEIKNQDSRKIANAQLDIYDRSQQIILHSLST